MIMPETVEVEESIINEIRRALEITGQMYGVESSAISVTLTDNETIHKLNLQYRGIDRATDVLSFAFRESEEPEIQGTIEELGEIIISVERAQEQSQEYGHSFKREIIFLTIHGMLHLLGYDHMEETERQEMEQEQKIIMERLGINR